MQPPDIDSRICLAFENPVGGIGIGTSSFISFTFDPDQ